MTPRLMNNRQDRLPAFRPAKFLAASGRAGRRLGLLGLALLGLISTARAQTASVKVLHQFSAFNVDGLAPSSALILGKDGNFYGTTTYNNADAPGTVFKITPAGIVTVLHSFTFPDSHDINSDGATPVTGLIQGRDGNFYGTTTVGGANGYGTIYQLTSAGVLTTLHSFSAADGKGINSDGTSPDGLIEGTDGDFYGTGYHGGKGGAGTVFKITSGGVFTILHSFSALDASGDNGDGAQPAAGVIQGKDGNFYGTTYNGGKSGYGTVYKVTAAGVFTTLYTFTGTNGGGVNPDAPLVQGTDGNFYGTVENGGATEYGAVFKITPAGVLTILHSFDDSDGAFPVAGLIQNTDGNFYGTTEEGGTDLNGTVFKMTPAGVLTTLHSFSGDNVADGLNGDGARPTAGVARGSDGNFYGITSADGAGEYGTVFKITSAGVLTTLHSFGYPNGDGANTNAALIQGSDGNFYGTARQGGTDGVGVVYKSTAAGVLTTLHSFHYDDGADPEGGLVQGKDGNFYGTATEGGANGYGTVFKITPAGVLTTLHNFSTVDSSTFNRDGAIPDSGLVQGSDGNFFGVAQDGGTAGYGTVFKITSAGVLTTLHSFSTLTANANSGGANPVARLIQGRDGNFYGTAIYGGTGGAGTVFKITSAGALTTLHSFSTPDSVGINGDGANPLGGLVQGTDGNFYGTAPLGGTRGYGTVFKVTSAGVFTVLHDFSAETSTATNSDGASSQFPPIVGIDGNFYGTAVGGGTSGAGTVFKMTPAGVFTTLYDFNPLASSGIDTGAEPVGLLQGKDGNFYTATFTAGTGGTGTIIEITLTSTPVITSAATASGTTGKAFSYQIMATGNPTSYGVQGLPGGLTLNASTGLISGSPKVAGTDTLTLHASNATGKGSAALTLTIALGPPVVTSATTASGKVGAAFSFQITASGSPTSYGVQGLPGGLSVNSTSGLISGTPKTAGAFTLTLNCYNAAGKGAASLILTITN